MTRNATPIRSRADRAARSSKAPPMSVDEKLSWALFIILAALTVFVCLK
jgi:hypothetical protein